MMEKHRDIAFDVHQLTDEKWEWVVYPKIGQGTRFSGVSPTAAKANKKAARPRIDPFLEGKAAAN
jgi:hypothetical protein